MRITEYLPNFYRSIKNPSRLTLYNKRIFLGFSVFMSLLFIVFSALLLIDIVYKVNAQNSMRTHRQELQKEKQGWMQIVGSYPDYRDGYIQLAELEYQLQEFESARSHIEKALFLDPNSEKARKLQQLLDREKMAP